jgi:hypothetical protein
VFCLHKYTTIHNTKCKTIKIFSNYFCNNVAFAHQIVQFIAHFVQQKVQKVVKILPIKAFESKVYRVPRMNIRVSKA